MNPDLLDLQSFCICGEYLQEDEEFCSMDCERDYYDVQYQVHLMESQYENHLA